MSEGDLSPRIEFECGCGGRSRWQPADPTGDDAYIECGNCEARYAITLTRLTAGSS
jgi:hypothetical protein